MNTVGQNKTQALTARRRLPSNGNGCITSRVDIHLVDAHGQCKATKLDNDIGLVEAGEMFGEMSFLQGTPATANVVAVDECTVEILSGNFVLMVHVHRPLLAARFYHNLAKLLQCAS